MENIKSEKAEAQKATAKKAETQKPETAGECPVCNGEVLDYDGTELHGDYIGYLFSCADCNAQGTEWYRLTFSNFDVRKGAK